jgi:hypothetical protein
METFSKPVPNATRRHWRKTYGMQASHMTRCQKLDGTICPHIPKTGKDADRSLAHLEAFVLDTLASLLEAGRLTREATANAATQALKFLGNAHVQISSESRKRVIAYLNQDPLVEEVECFQKAAHLLFGKECAKEHVDSVRSLRKISTFPMGRFFPDLAAPTLTTRLLVGVVPSEEVAGAEEESDSSQLLPHH